MDITQSSSEGQLMASNTNFFTILWNSTGGGVAIFNASTPVRCPANLPLIRGHKSYVVDVKFSPFRSDLLATASDDSTVKLWEIPQDGLTDDTQMNYNIIMVMLEKYLSLILIQYVLM